MNYITATSNRGGPEWTTATRKSPLRHAARVLPPRYSPGGKTFRAVCGVQVANLHEVAFNPSAPRTCPKCRAAVG